MKSRHLLAALAATCLAVFQGCDSSQSIASVPGDRSSEGKGGVAFRLSPQNVSVLNANSYYLQYKVSGPGIDSFSAIYGTVWADTAPTFIQNVPCGTRIVEITAMGYNGIATWYGADTIEVNPGQYSFAHLTLHKLANPYGTVVLDISLDSMQGTDSSVRAPIDTVWHTQIIPSWYTYSYSYCNSPVWGGPGDSLRVNCTNVIYRPLPGDTTWVDTTVHYPVSDTAHWCIMTSLDSGLVDTLGAHASFRCYRPHYEPYTGPVDTIWSDTLVGPSDTTTYCYSIGVDKVHCIRPIHAVPVIDTFPVATKPKKKV